MTRISLTTSSRPQARVSAWTSVGLAACACAVMATTACGGGSRSRPATPGATAGPGPGPAPVECETGERLLREQAFAAAAEALDRCIASNPTRAYAYYYAGMAYRQIDRVDQMTDRFETFVRLAPDAPERPQVESILRTVR